MRDFLNQPITVGSTVVYPVRQGSRLWLNKMIVTDVAKFIEGYLPDHPGKRRVWVGKPERCVVVDRPAFSAEAAVREHGFFACLGSLVLGAANG